MNAKYIWAPPEHQPTGFVLDATQSILHQQEQSKFMDTSPQEKLWGLREIWAGWLVAGLARLQEF